MKMGNDLISARLVRANKIALGQGWHFSEYQENCRMVSYIKDKMRINIYLTRMTVATCLEHPIHGKTQLYRKNVDDKTLKEIFKNPRVHTGKGYRQGAKQKTSGRLSFFKQLKNAIFGKR